jgi:hypothetical protein
MELTAYPEVGFIFTQWGGGGIGTMPFQSFSLDSDKNFIAEFDYFPTLTPTPTDTATPTPTGTPTPTATPTPPGGGGYMTRLTAGISGQYPSISAISANGRYIAYHYNGNIWRYDQPGNPPEAVAAGGGSTFHTIDILADGQYIAYDAPGPYFTDVFLYDHNTGTSQNLTNHPQNSSISSLYVYDIQVEIMGDSVLVGYAVATNFYDDPSEYHIWLYDSAQGTPPRIRQPSPPPTHQQLPEHQRLRPRKQLPPPVHRHLVALLPSSQRRNQPRPRPSTHPHL